MPHTGQRQQTHHIPYFLSGPLPGQRSPRAQKRQAQVVLSISRLFRPHACLLRRAVTCFLLYRTIAIFASTKMVF